MLRERSKNQLKCFCSRKPLLAVYGIDPTGRTYVHCRVFKQNRVYGDWISYGGEVKILCRECFRWHSIVFVGPKKDTAKLEESVKPEEIEEVPMPVELIKEGLG